jgi:AcrR family transcriptional regulator
MPKKTFYNLPQEKQERILNAAINEFSSYPFKSASINRLIKEANIPRGSFYQYFDNKKDIYLYLFEHMTSVKMSYLGDDINNPRDLPFVDLFEILIEKGLRFVKDNIKLAKITGYLLMNKDDLYNEIMKSNIDIAIGYYANYIDADKAKGIIRQDVDTYSLARLISTLSIQSSTDHFLSYDMRFEYDKISHDLKSIINILKKGIEADETHV